MVLYSYDETPDQHSSPWHVRVDCEQGSTTGKYSLGGINDIDLQLIGLQILGSTDPINQRAGMLTRTIPLAHPILNNWYAASFEANGNGVPLRVDASNQIGVTNPTITAQFLKYPKYWFTIDFKRTPYDVLPDNAITTNNGSFFDTDDAGDPAPAKTFVWCNEFLRFLDVDVQSRNDIEHGTVGNSLSFKTGPAGIINSPFSGQTWVNLRNSDVIFTWFGVPYRYLTSANSYLENFKGRVNQNALTFGQYSWDPGQLLYLGYKQKKYNPPILPTVNLIVNQNQITTNLKLCTITMSFLGTSRQIAKGESYVPVNRNFVVGGHNLLPHYLDRKFHYSATKNDVASFYSFPFELFFMDPDVAQPFPFNTDG